MISILALLVVSLSSAPLPAQGTSSVCKDGTASAASGRGACSGHGGVDAKATAAAAKAAKMTVVCTDGTKSAGGRGACSSHGGIAKAVATAPKATSSMAKTPKADSVTKKPTMSTMGGKTASKAKPKP